MAHGKYIGFKKLRGQIAKKGGVMDPGAVAATAGKKMKGMKPAGKAKKTFSKMRSRHSSGY